MRLHRAYKVFSLLAVWPESESLMSLKGLSGRAWISACKAAREMRKLAQSPVVQAVIVGGVIAVGSSMARADGAGTALPLPSATVGNFTDQVYGAMGAVSGAAAGVFGFKWTIHMVRSFF